MEHLSLAEDLKSTTEKQRAALQAAEQEKAEHAMQSAAEQTAEYMEQHKESFINELAENAKRAANRGETTASISYRENIANMYSLLQTSIAVRDYFLNEGFDATIDSGDDGSWSSDGRLNRATSCWTQISIDWSNR